MPEDATARAETTARFPDLEGASVFVTGGGSGIGAALTEGFAAQGARVAFVGRRDAGAFAADVAGRTGAEVLYIPCDVTDVAALRAAVARASDAHGPVRVLVSNAANDDRHGTLDVTEGYWDANQAVNLKAYFFAAQAAIPGMVAQGRGAIVNFSSISYMMGLGDYPSYASANAGITGLTRGLAREWGRKGIRANAIAPGWVLTERQKELWVTEEGLRAHLARQCLPEALQPSDIVGGTLFLSSDASRMVTGQVLVIDGGVVTTG
jgi:NAD(P)-dependent dehydrogenase (short-subunit alcohol dehydrogenase family)